MDRSQHLIYSTSNYSIWTERYSRKVINIHVCGFINNSSGCHQKLKSKVELRVIGYENLSFFKIMYIMDLH